MVQVVKFSNHLAEQGFTDALAGAENLLFATSFDIDSGKECNFMETHKTMKKDYDIYNLFCS